LKAFSESAFLKEIIGEKMAQLAGNVGVKGTLNTCILAAALLAGCGGGGITGEPVGGRLVDGYISGASVCLDLNANAACDADEPRGITDANGSWTLYAAKGTNLADYFVIADIPSTGAYDSDAPGVQLSASKMLAPANESQVISPLTTVVSGFMMAGDSAESAKTKTRSLLGLPGSYNFASDHVALGDTQAHAAAKVVNAALTNAVGSQALSLEKLKLAVANSSEKARQAYSNPEEVGNLVADVKTITENIQPVYETVAPINMAKFNGFGSDGPPFLARFIGQYKNGGVFSGYQLNSAAYGSGLEFTKLNQFANTINGAVKLEFDLFVSGKSNQDLNAIYVMTQNPPNYWHDVGADEKPVQISESDRGRWTAKEVTLNMWDIDSLLIFRSGARKEGEGPYAEFAVANLRITSPDGSKTAPISVTDAGWGAFGASWAYPEGVAFSASDVSRGDVIRGTKTNGAQTWVGMSGSDFANGLTGTAVTIQIDVKTVGKRYPVQIYLQAQGAEGYKNVTQKVTLTPTQADEWQTLTFELNSFRPAEHKDMVVLLDPESVSGDQQAYFSNFKVVSVVNPFE
jgi:hypothetical protein